VITIASLDDHAWIEYRNPNTGEFHTCGCYQYGYGGQRDENGNWIVPPVAIAGSQWDKEIEQGRPKRPNASRRPGVTIQDPTITIKRGFEPQYGNCASYARDEWYKLTGEQLYSGILWHDPSTLKRSIDAKNDPSTRWKWELEPVYLY
jgi:hypothetical protein